jgi:hypothetical protein
VPTRDLKRKNSGWANGPFSEEKLDSLFGGTCCSCARCVANDERDHAFSIYLSIARGHKVTKNTLAKVTNPNLKQALVEAICLRTIKAKGVKK